MKEEECLSLLKQYWGYDSFRPMQMEIIQSVLQGKDTLALLPTGGGKSICFQIPALLHDGICVVVTPLIALMKDQVTHLRKNGIQAVAIYSGMRKREIDIILDNCVYGKIKFLYLSPERLYSDLVRERIRYMKVNLFAIDEAHCISQWGYDFRPPYLELAKLRELHATVPFLALTATATPQVVQDIQARLLFPEENVFVKSFRRDNLAYMAFEEEDKTGRMIRIIRKLGGCGIVYVRNRRETQEVARVLVNQGITADFYHAGLPGHLRDQKQDAWMNNELRVIVATNAFGMGIDKPDVRFVIHLDLPDSLEAYYQEAGRAGRDGKKAYPVVLYHAEDKKKLQDDLKASFPDVKFIQQVYHQLCNHYQIAYESGLGVTVDFDVVAFSKKYRLQLLAVMSALKFLEKDGWIALSDAMRVPSRLKVEVSGSDLYKFQVQYAKYDKLIKAILRTYGGAFDDFIPINEYEFAKKLGISYTDVTQRLIALQNLEILSYLPATDEPQLTFRQNRVDYRHLYIDHVFIRERKSVKEREVGSMIGYLEEAACRSQYMQLYFGEKNATFCQVCDLCLLRNHTAKQSVQLKKQIQSLLMTPMNLHDLVDSLTIGTTEQRIELVRSLLDLGKIRIGADGLYFWNTVF